MKFNELQTQILLVEAIQQTYKNISLNEAVELSKTIISDKELMTELNKLENMKRLSLDGRFINLPLKSEDGKKELFKIDINDDKRFNVTFKDESDRVKTEQWKLGKTLLTLFPDLKDNDVLRQTIETKIKTLVNKISTKGKSKIEGIPDDFSLELFKHSDNPNVVEKWYKKLQRIGVRSCVTDKDEDVTEDFYYFYNLAKANILILFKNDNPIGRALVWDNVADKPYLDRTYPAGDDGVREIYLTYARHMGWYYRRKNGYGDYDDIGPSIPRASKFGFMIDINELDKTSSSGGDLLIPYLDTFRFGQTDKKNGTTFFTNTSKIKVGKLDRLAEFGDPEGTTYLGISASEIYDEEEDENPRNEFEIEIEALIDQKLEIVQSLFTYLENARVYQQDETTTIELFNNNLNFEMYNWYWSEGTFGTEDSREFNHDDQIAAYNAQSKNRFTEGSWEGGTWINGEFIDSKWNDGLWKNGEFIDSKWLGGIWENGEFDSESEWESGEFKGGNFRGKWHNGIFLGGEFSADIFDEGEFKGGTFLGKKFYSRSKNSVLWINGIFDGEIFANSVWEDGLFLGGMFHNGYWKGGKWKDGVWTGGNWESGWIYDPSNRHNNKKDSEGFCYSTVDPSTYFK
jgi:hypothetical protein